MKSMIFHPRVRARECALQALYSWAISNNDFFDVERYFMDEHDMKGVNIVYFHKLCFGVVNSVDVLDNLMKPYLSRQFKQLGYVELTVLRIAIFELIEYLNLPYRVIINEAIQLAKTFGGEQSYKFINGVLDKVSEDVR